MMKTLKSMWQKMGAGMLALSATLACTTAFAVNNLPGGPAVNQIDLHPPVTQIAMDQRWLHNFMLIICLVIFLAVFGVMFWSIFHHRKSKGAKAAHFHESTTVEIIWTIVPFIIVIFMALPATKVVVAMKDTTAADLTIKATGYQWKWGYDYLKGEGEGIGFVSTLDASHRAMSDAGKPEGDNYLLKVDNPLVVPVDKKVRIITTANDVIHSFMVPAFGIKQDAIPGFVRDTWFRANQVGDFYGQCTELCGKEHAYMPIHVKVLSGKDYALWAEGKKKEMAAKADDPNKVWALPELSARGQKVYDTNCASCHKADGKGGGPVKAVDGSAIVRDADRTKQIKLLLAGVTSKGMPAWASLSDTDLAAVSTYTKNNWSNKTGQIVQPADVAAVRAGKDLAPGAASAAPVAAVTEAITAPVAASSADTALPVNVYFASGQSGLDSAAAKAVAAAAVLLKAKPGAKVVLSGFVDATGTAAKNAEIAKERAKNVSAALQKAGVEAGRIELRKPEKITAAKGQEAQARRVEIRLAS
jgi:cytochrome c oxidase subunit II